MGVISDKQEITSLDYSFLFNSLFPNCKYHVKYFGVSRIKQQTGFGKDIQEKTIRFADNLRRVRNSLQKHNVEYRATGNLLVRNRDECKKCGAKDYKMQEKGVDVGLAVDIVKDIYANRVKSVALFSSDTDLIPAVKIALEKNVKFTYITVQNHVNRALSRLSNENTIIVKDSLLAEAYARSLKND